MSIVIFIIEKGQRLNFKSIGSHFWDGGKGFIETALCSLGYSVILIGEKQFVVCELQITIDISEENLERSIIS